MTVGSIAIAFSHPLVILLLFHDLKLPFLTFNWIRSPFSCEQSSCNKLLIISVGYQSILSRKISNFSFKLTHAKHTNSYFQRVLVLIFELACLCQTNRNHSSPPVSVNANFSKTNYPSHSLHLEPSTMSLLPCVSWRHWSGAQLDLVSAGMEIPELGE